MKRLLLTGGNGFVGSHLLPILEKNDYEVLDLHAGAVNLNDKSSITKALGATKWNIVIHLAGISSVADCDRDPANARLVNVEYTKMLLEAVARTNPYAHFVFASTAQVYAPGEKLSETSAIAPINLYAQLKWEAEQAIQSFSEKSDLSATILRFFNHTHKTQPPNAFMPHIYKALMEVKGSAGPQKIPVGNLDLSRDIGSVRDLVQAILGVIQQQTWDFETFNVCSGHPKNLRTLAELLAAKLEVKPEFVVDPARVRANDPITIAGSHAKLTGATGWSPRVKTESQLIDDFLAD